MSSQDPTDEELAAMSTEELAAYNNGQTPKPKKGGGPGQSTRQQTRPQQGQSSSRTESKETSYEPIRTYNKSPLLWFDIDLFIWLFLGSLSLVGTTGWWVDMIGTNNGTSSYVEIAVLSLGSQLVFDYLGYHFFMLLWRLYHTTGKWSKEDHFFVIPMGLIAISCDILTNTWGALFIVSNLSKVQNLRQLNGGRPIDLEGIWFALLLALIAMIITVAWVTPFHKWLYRHRLVAA